MRFNQGEKKVSRKRTIGKKIALFLCLMSITIIFLQPHAAIARVVETEYGRVRGLIDVHTSTYAWLGIPYAKPPVGDLRWKPPEDPTPWDGILTTKEFDNACAQVGGLYGPPAPGESFGLSIINYLGLPSGCEDCLTLNIWRPIWSPLNWRREQLLPVIVFIHGGSNKQSYAADPMWHGGNLARETNAVVITVNYRLGVFGWFAHPALRSGDALQDSANFGTLDLIKALKFVKENIVNFGGDPENVTVMGQSAGSANVYSLMVSPLTEGLMDKAVLMSGPGLNGTPLSTGEGYANSVLRQLLIDDGIAADTVANWIVNHTNQEIADYLRGKSTEEILTALVHGGLTSPPNIFADGNVVPMDSNAEVNKGNFRNVPVIIGATLDEGKLFVPYLYKVTDAERFSLMYNFDADHPSGPDPSYFLNVTVPIFENTARNAPVLSTQWFTNLIDATAVRLSAKQPKVYAYRFEWNTAPEPWKTIYGAVHVLDTPFMFGNFQEQLFSCMYGKYNKKGRRALSNAMMDSLGAFARTGDPNHKKLGVLWEPWSNDPGGPKKLIFDADEKNLQLKMVNTTVLPPIPAP